MNISSLQAAPPAPRFGSQFTVNLSPKSQLYDHDLYKTFCGQPQYKRKDGIICRDAFLQQQAQYAVEGVKKAVKASFTPPAKGFPMVFYGRYNSKKINIAVPNKFDAIVRSALDQQLSEQRLNVVCYADSSESHPNIISKEAMKMAVRRINHEYAEQGVTQPRHFRALSGRGTAVRSKELFVAA